MKISQQQRAARGKMSLIVTYQRQIKDWYAAIDQLLQEMVAAGVAVGTTVQDEEGNTHEYVDQFADRNVVFRPAGVRRFDVVPMTRKRAEELNNGRSRKTGR